MKGTHLTHKIALAACFAMLFSTSSIANVKDGVDAWSQGNYKKAVTEWREPALRGDADAQFNLGQAYKLGRGVEQSTDIALDWYSKAAKQGHLQSQDSMGRLLHYKGNIKQALPYLQTSARRGDAISQYLLATELFNGEHIGKNWVRAYALMTRASSSGMPAASRSLAQMDKHIPLQDRQRGTALAGTLEVESDRIRKQQVAGLNLNTTPVKPSILPVSVPPSNPTVASSKPGFPNNAKGQPSSRPVATRPVASRPVASRPVTARPAPLPVAPAASGKYRVQLGAFGQETNARKLWNRLETSVPSLANIQPYLKSSGNITRLQAGPFNSKSSAEAMCSKVKAKGQSCIVISRF